jgi:hypothetical protein
MVLWYWVKDNGWRSRHSTAAPLGYISIGTTGCMYGNVLVSTNTSNWKSLTCSFLTEANSLLQDTHVRWSKTTSVMITSQTVCTLEIKKGCLGFHIQDSAEYVILAIIIGSIFSEEELQHVPKLYTDCVNGRFRFLKSHDEEYIIQFKCWDLPYVSYHAVSAVNICKLLLARTFSLQVSKMSFSIMHRLVSCDHCRCLNGDTVLNLEQIYVIMPLKFTMYLTFSLN